MTDIVDSATRSRMMSGIRGSDTKQEILLRKALFARGFRYRVNARNIFGTPDVVFPSRQAILFVHGCFWHGHNCDLFKLPRTRTEFWAAKIGRNRQRDRFVQDTLMESGWRVCTVWECALRGTKKLGLDPVADLVASWLKSTNLRESIRGNTSSQI